MPSTDAALRMNSAQSAGCVVLTLTVGLLIDPYSEWGSIVENATFFKHVLVRSLAVISERASIVVRAYFVATLSVWPPIVQPANPPVPMRLEFFRTLERSILRGLFDLAKNNSPSNARLGG
jgi:hypothetical protein